MINFSIGFVLQTDCQSSSIISLIYVVYDNIVDVTRERSESYSSDDVEHVGMAVAKEIGRKSSL